MSDEYESRDENTISEKIVNYAQHLASNPKYAIDAIKSRNLTIKSLKSQIKHINIASKEIEERLNYMALHKDKYETMYISSENAATDMRNSYYKLLITNEELKTKVSILESRVLELTYEIKLIEKFEKRSWAHSVKTMVDKMPRWSIIGPLLGFLLTPPTSRFVVIFLFVIIFMASLVGWELIITQLKLIFGIFGG